MDRYLDSFVSASGSYCMFKARWEIDCRRMKHNGGLEYRNAFMEMEKTRMK